jgi:hypothetical protein
MPARTDRLIARLDSWCSSDRGRQAEAARAIEVSPQRINDWINHRVHPTAEQVLALVEFLDQCSPHISESPPTSMHTTKGISMTNLPNSKKSKIRWLDTSWRSKELRAKRIFAEFTTRAGESYSGIGEIRVRENPEGKLAIELVFTRRDSPYQFTDIIYYLSSRQIPQLVKEDNADYDFIYRDHLYPDIELADS